MISTGRIYIIKNTVNNKVYIGQTVKSVKDRFNQHMRDAFVIVNGEFKAKDKFHSAIRDIGTNKFYVETLGEFAKEDLDLQEYLYIKAYDSSFRKSLTETKRYASDLIADSKLVKARLIKTKRQLEREQHIKWHGEDVDNSISSDYPPSNETLLKLLLNHSVNKIAQHYGVSFTSMKNLLQRRGLPYNKETIAEYRGSN